MNMYNGGIGSEGTLFGFAPKIATLKLLFYFLASVFSNFYPSDRKYTESWL